MVDFYNTAKVIEASPVITQIVDAKDHSDIPANTLFARGFSPLRCYNPLFGYALEKLNVDKLQLGRIDLQTTNQFNFRNPACLVFPAANKCELWDNFFDSQRSELESFVSYRGFHFIKSKVQNMADVISLTIICFTLIFLSIICILKLRTRRWI